MTQVELEGVLKAVAATLPKRQRKQDRESNTTRIISMRQRKPTSPDKKRA